MELEDGFDELLCQIDEPALPKKPKITESDQIEASTSSQTIPRPAKSKTHCILVNKKQRGNPLLKYISEVPWEFDDVIPDYEIGKKVGILFLSLKYYNLKPDYINERLKELGKKYELQVLLVQVDLKDPHVPLKALNKICLLADLTLMLAWNPEEAANIVQTYKVYENKPADSIMEKVENDPYQKVINALTSIKPVNKTDAATLIATFGTLGNIIQASESRLAKCPGVGERKAKKLFQAFNGPFLKKNCEKVPESKENTDKSIEEKS